MEDINEVFSRLEKSEKEELKNFLKNNYSTFKEARDFFSPKRKMMEFEKVDFENNTIEGLIFLAFSDLSKEIELKKKEIEGYEKFLEFFKTKVDSYFAEYRC